MSVNLIDFLSTEDSTALVKRLRQHRFRKDEFILGQEDDTDDVFLMLDGFARATVFGSDGSVVAYRDVGPGAIFGEFAAIDGKPRSASVVATEDSEVGLMTSSEFRNMIRENPEIAWAVIQHLTAQARAMTQRIFEFSTMLVRERLIRELLRLSDEAVAEAGERIISPAPSHFTLATRISSHREAVSREMSQLSKLGLLSKRKNVLIVHDQRGLEDLLNEFNAV